MSKENTKDRKEISIDVTQKIKKKLKSSQIRRKKLDKISTQLNFGLHFDYTPYTCPMSYSKKFQIKIIKDISSIIIY